MSISSQGPVNSSSPNENGNDNIVQPEHITPSSALQLQCTTPTCSSLEDLMPKKKPMKYMECLKNHAAAIGGHATDGCGEFMPGGEEGSIEALKCSACNCHRNFHKKVIQEKYSPQALDHAEKELTSGDQNHGLGPEKLGDCPKGTLIFSNSKVKKTQISMPSKKVETHTSETDEQEVGCDFLRRPNGLGKRGIEQNLLKNKRKNVELCRKCRLEDTNNR